MYDPRNRHQEMSKSVEASERDWKKARLEELERERAQLVGLCAVVPLPALPCDLEERKASSPNCSLPAVTHGGVYTQICAGGARIGECLSLIHI